MIPEVLAFIFLALGPLYLAMRVLGYGPSRDKNVQIKSTSSGKIHHSKVGDAAFFDGASEDYKEAMDRIKQVGGA
ncbi:MAG: hypothetical protein ACXABV_10505 [Candidatus Thorarchaeota archaeon]